ncbi:MAG: hypothetical protein IH597_08905 [Bacteroidales bacterium]|nr:hypothetical protein [Bacteroidales bacterium]
MANPIVKQINDELASLQKELKQFKQTSEYLNGARNSVKQAIDTINGTEQGLAKKVEELKETYEAFIRLTQEVDKVTKKISTVNFPERLDKIEDTVKATIKILDDTRESTLQELQKASEVITRADFSGRFSRLQNAIDASVASNKTVAETIKKEQIPEKVETLTNKLSRDLDRTIKSTRNHIQQTSDELIQSIQSLSIPDRMIKLDASITGISASIQNVQARLETLERNLGDKVKEGFEKQTQIINSLQIQLQQNNELMKKKVQVNSYITWAIIMLTAGAILFIIL